MGGEQAPQVRVPLAHVVLGVWQVHPHMLPPRQLPLGLYKKVLVIMHDSILPHLAQPSLMIDFLTRAYDMGECLPGRASSGTRRAGPWGGGVGWAGASPPCMFAGGAISLLALNGLFILIHQHNL